MSILITGGTGFVGKRLIQKLIDRTTNVIPTPIILCTRKIDRSNSLMQSSDGVLSSNRPNNDQSFSILPFQWSPTDGPIDLTDRLLQNSGELSGAIQADREDANWRRNVVVALKQSPISTVINLMGESVAEGRWTKEKKRRIRESRVQGTRNLVDGLIQSNQIPQVFVSASAIGFYGDRADQTITEATKAGDDFLAEVGDAWESEADRMSEHGARVIKLRLGLVMGTDGGALQKMLPIFRWGGGGRLGSGQQWMSWIHIDDLISMIVWTMTQPDLAGPFNAVAPAPIRNVDFTKQLAAAVNRPAILPVPAFALKVTLGEFSQELLSSKRVVPQAALASGFKFEFETFDKAIADLLAAK